MFRFEKLDVWHRSIEFAELVYELTAMFQVDERFGLTSQMRRAAVSISSNIAERRQMLTVPQHQKINHQAEPIARMLSGFRTSLLSDA